MKQFEYRIVHLAPAYRDKTSMDKQELNGLGEDGYELVTIIDNIAYLKKEAPGLSPAQHKEMLTKKVSKTPEGPPLITVSDNLVGLYGDVASLSLGWPWWPFKRRK